MATKKRSRKGDYARFIKDRRAADPAFRARRNAAVAKWAAKLENKSKLFTQYLKRTYNLTPEQYESMLQVQNYRCGICGTTDPGIYTKGRVNRWHVDHNHVTGKIRGLLCGPCNIGLGNFHENVVALRNAVLYLEKNYEFE